MTTVEEIKKAATNLSPDEQVELFQWLHNSVELQQARYEQLKRDIAAGIEEADRGETSVLDVEEIKSIVRQLKNSGSQLLWPLFAARARPRTILSMLANLLRRMISAQPNDCSIGSTQRAGFCQDSLSLALYAKILRQICDFFLLAIT